MFEKSFQVFGKTLRVQFTQRRINNLRLFASVGGQLATLQLPLTITDTGLFKHPLSRQAMSWSETAFEEVTNRDPVTADNGG